MNSSTGLLVAGVPVLHGRGSERVAKALEERNRGDEWRNGEEDRG